MKTISICDTCQEIISKGILVNNDVSKINKWCGFKQINLNNIIVRINSCNNYKIANRAEIIYKLLSC